MQHPWRALLVLAGTIAVAVPQARAQSGPGTLSVRVTDAANQRPVEAARVFLVGTTFAGATGVDGRLSLRGIPAAEYTIRVLRVGYTEQTKRVPIAAGQTVTLEFAMATAAVNLAAVVTTATGEQRRVEIGNATANIDASKVLEAAPVSNLSDLLNSRAPGVTVTSGSQTGTGSRIRVRGMNSVSLSNEPIWIIDGIRMTSNNADFNTATGSGGTTGGNNASRVGDLNPEEIENIEIVKGPSAATLYGTEAANGVVVITTKRGKSGKTNYSLNVENGKIENTAVYPDLWQLWGRTAASPTRAVPCLLTAVSLGTCTSVDSLSHGNFLNDPSLTPISDGSRRQYNLQASGGNDKVQFFVSGQTEGETGIYKLPDNEIARLKTRRGVTELPSDIVRPNALARNSFRANVNAELRKGLFVQASSGYVNSELRLPQNEDNGNGLMVLALGGPWRGDLVDAQGDSLRGYRAFMLGDVLSQTTKQGLNRFINSVSAQWSPTTWLATRAAIGSDFTSRNDLFIAKVGEGPNTGTTRQGNITSQRVDINQQTADYGATGTFQLNVNGSASTAFASTVF